MCSAIYKPPHWPAPGTGSRSQDSSGGTVFQSMQVCESHGLSAFALWTTIMAYGVLLTTLAVPPSCGAVSIKRSYPFAW